MLRFIAHDSRHLASRYESLTVRSNGARVTFDISRLPRPDGGAVVAPNRAQL